MIKHLQLIGKLQGAFVSILICSTFILNAQPIVGSTMALPNAAYKLQNSTTYKHAEPVIDTVACIFRMVMPNH